MTIIRVAEWKDPIAYVWASVPDTVAENHARVRVLKRFGQWHWWCPDCMGGDWCPAWMDAIHRANRHARLHQ